MSLMAALGLPDGDQTLADTRPESKFDPGSRVQSKYTGHTGTVHKNRPSWYFSYEVPVVWDHRPHGGATVETKYNLYLLP